MNNKNWKDIYVQAALEVDKVKMVKRLLHARQAILERFQELEPSGDHHVERNRMDIALKNLTALETESWNW